jgi:hypothetical protein
LTLWKQFKHFPVHFVEIAGFTETTQLLITQLNRECSAMICQIEEAAEIDLLIETLKPRGLLTMLGFRQTTGSQDIAWPS